MAAYTQYVSQDTNSTIKSLITALSSPDDLSRMKARKSLADIGGPSVLFLAEALNDPNHLVRWEAVKALGEIGDPKAAPALVRALEDEEFDVRWLAAKGLIEINVKGLKPLFGALIEHADSVFLREGAHHVLHDLSKGELRKYLVPVLIALEDSDSAVQVPIAASHALEMLEKFQEAQKMEDPFLKKFTLPIFSQIALDLGSHKRARRYARSLRNL